MVNNLSEVEQIVWSCLIEGLANPNQYIFINYTNNLLFDSLFRTEKASVYNSLQPKGYILDIQKRFGVDKGNFGVKINLDQLPADNLS